MPDTAMNYWVVKGSPSENNWQAMLHQGKLGTWWTSKLGEKLQKRDRFFFWQSSPLCRIVALGEIVNPRVSCIKGKHRYRVRYLTGWLERKPTITELREFPALSDASFLKRGAASCIFPITVSQGSLLFYLAQSPSQNLHEIWPDLDPTRITNHIQFDDLDGVASEGNVRLVEHLRRERNRTLVQRKKKDALLKHGRLICECCGFDFQNFYGEPGRDFCEVHHTKPLADVGKRMTALHDLAIVCSNCHRIIHRKKPMITIGQLSNLIKKASKKTR